MGILRSSCLWPIALAGIVGISLLPAACTGQDREPPHPPPATFDEAFEIEGTLVLQEVGDTLVAAPNLRWDPEGGWLYWDGMIPQVRKYDAQGQLVAVMGGGGDGPGEFTRVVSFMRSPGGDLVSVDASGRIATWSDAGELIGEFSAGVAPIAGAVPLGEHVLLVSRFGLGSGPEAPHWLHLADRGLRGVSASIAGPAIPAEHVSAAMTVEGPQPREVDGIAHIGLSSLDTLWSWPDAAAGGALEAMPVPSPSMGRNEVPPQPGPDMRAFQEWFGASWFLGDFTRLPDGRWLYLIWSFRDQAMVGRFLLTDSQGTALWEVDGDFRFVAVDPEGRILLSDAAGANPAELLVARVRRTDP